MPLAIGRPSARNTSSDPTELLAECHDRIRQAMRGARGLAAVAAGDPAIAPTAAAVHRYFSVALPLHSQDEDASLAPRLFAAGIPADLEDAVTTMTAQHADIDMLLERLLPLWDRLQKEPGALDEVRQTLANHTARLDALWDIHLAVEEHYIFPRAALVLNEEARAAIVEEMRARRLPPSR